VTGTTYLYPGFSPSAAAANPISWEAAKAFTIKKIRYAARVGGTGAGTLTYDVRKGATSLATITVSPADTTGNNTANISVAEGDPLNVEVTKSGEFLTSPTDVCLTIGTEA
jgi:hypothetical protein